MTGSTNKDLRARDFQRSKVYDLDMALDPLHTISGSLSLQECDALIHRAHAHFDRRWQGRTTDGRGARRAYGSMTRISLPVWSRRPDIVLHEAAHALLQRIFWQDQHRMAHHSPQFVRIMIELWAAEGLATIDWLETRAGMAGVYVSGDPRCFPPRKIATDPVELRAAGRMSR